MPAFDLTRLQAETCVASIDYHHQVGSTNDRAIELIKNWDANSKPLEFPLLVLTEIQTRGRGSRNRSWIASAGALTLSLCVKSENATWEPAIPVCLALSICRAIEISTGCRPDDLAIKWPNDILIGDRKVGGILVEKIKRTSIPIQPAELEEDFLVIGIGLNGSNQVLESDLQDCHSEGRSKKVLRPTSLVAHLGRSIDLTRLLIELIRQIEKTFQRLADDPVDAIAEVYQRIVFADCLVTLEQPGGRLVSGRFRGLTTQGELIIESDGRDLVVASGQVIDWEGFEGKKT